VTETEVIRMLREALIEVSRVEQRDVRNDKPWTIHDGDSYADLVRSEESRKALERGRRRDRGVGQTGDVRAGRQAPPDERGPR